LHGKEGRKRRRDPCSKKVRLHGQVSSALIISIQTALKAKRQLSGKQPKYHIAFLPLLQVEKQFFSGDKNQLQFEWQT
jgi:hypothetical protein